MLRQSSRCLHQLFGQPWWSSWQAAPDVLTVLASQGFNQQPERSTVCSGASSTADHAEGCNSIAVGCPMGGQWLHQGQHEASSRPAGVSCLDAAPLHSHQRWHAPSVLHLAHLSSTPSWSHHQTRSASTLPKAGIPKPRPGVENVMSTHKGGHLARTLKLTQTLAELDAALQQHEDSLTPLHWAVAALQLERLCRQERASPTSLRVKSIASRIEQAAVQAAPRLAVMHLAPILHGLSGARHALSEPSLTSLAAVLLAGQCRQLQLASDVNWKQLVWSFCRQGFNHPGFWRQLCSHAVPLMVSQSWHPDRVAAVVKDIVSLGVRSDALMVQALNIMTQQMSKMRPGSLVDGVFSASLCYPGVLNTHQAPGAPETPVSPELLAAFADAATQQALTTLPAFNQKQLILLLAYLARLGAGSPETASKVAAALLARPAEVIPALYADKLTSACASMKYKDDQLIKHVARMTISTLDAADPGTLYRLAAGMKAAGGDLPEVKALLDAVQQQQANLSATTA